jgi:threonine/homoserine/homoserine lactone efflux protein
MGTRRAFREGVVVEALNPKTAAFFLAFIPQFLDPSAGVVALPFILLGCISVALNTLADIVVALGASRIREGAGARPRLIRRLREISGASMIALGAGLALAKRQ